jgi:hypothetical protein
LIAVHGGRVMVWNNSVSKSKRHDGKPKTVQVARQGEANKVSIDLETE